MAVLVVGFVMVVIQEEVLHHAVDAQVPGAVVDVSLAEGVVRVLERAPVQRERAVTREPAGRRQIQRPDEGGLQGEREEDLEADGPLGGVHEAGEHGLGAGLPEQTRRLDARRQAEGAWPDQIQQAPGGQQQPIDAGEHAVPLQRLHQPALPGKNVVEQLRVAAVPPVMTEMTDALKAETGGEERGHDPADRLVDGSARMHVAVHRLVQQRKDGVVDVGEREGRADPPAPGRGVRGGHEETKGGGGRDRRQRQVQRARDRIEPLGPRLHVHAFRRRPTALPTSTPISAPAAMPMPPHCSMAN